MNKKYIFSTEAKAEEMILSLVTASEETINFRDVKRTESTKGIVCLGFQDKTEIDSETEEVTIIEGLTFNVDISWITVSEDWDAFEVFPETSNHKFL